MTNELRRDTATPLWQLDPQDEYFDRSVIRAAHNALDNDDYEDWGLSRMSCEGLAIEAAERMAGVDPASSKNEVLAILSEYFLAQQRSGFPIQETDPYVGTQYRSAEANNLVITVAAQALAGNEAYGSEDTRSDLEILVRAAQEAENFYLAGTLIAIDVLGKTAALLASPADPPIDIEHELETIDFITVDALFAFYQAKGFETVRPQFDGTNIETDIDKRMQEVGGYLVNRSGVLAPNPHLRNAFFAATNH